MVELAGILADFLAAGGRLRAWPGPRWAMVGHARRLLGGRDGWGGDRRETLPLASLGGATLRNYLALFQLAKHHPLEFWPLPLVFNPSMRSFLESIQPKNRVSWLKSCSLREVICVVGQLGSVHPSSYSPSSIHPCPSILVLLQFHLGKCICLPTSLSLASS